MESLNSYQCYVHIFLHYIIKLKTEGVFHRSVLNYINKPLNFFCLFPLRVSKNDCGNQTYLTVADDINAQVTARGTVFCFFTYIECDSVKTRTLYSDSWFKLIKRILKTSRGSNLGNAGVIHRLREQTVDNIPLPWHRSTGFPP